MIPPLFGISYLLWSMRELTSSLIIVRQHIGFVTFIPTKFHFSWFRGTLTRLTLDIVLKILAVVHRFSFRWLPCDIYPICLQGGVPVGFHISLFRPEKLIRNHTISPKLIPWFVSDVTPPDFKDIIPLLLNPATFPNPHTDLDNNSRSSHLNELASRWQKYVQTGVFSLSVPQETTLGSDSPVGNFWTTPYPYWDMKLRAPDVFAHLKESSLVIFKVGVLQILFMLGLNIIFHDRVISSE